MLKKPIKYRLICIKRSYFIDPMDIEKVKSVPNSSHYLVTFKNPLSKSLHIQRRVFRRLIRDFPNLLVI